MVNSSDSITRWSVTLEASNENDIDKKGNNGHTTDLHRIFLWISRI